MTKEEFTELCCRNGNSSRETFEKYRVALPCYCGDDSCRGWASVQNDPEAIEEHMERHGQPKSIIQ